MVNGQWWLTMAKVNGYQWFLGWLTIFMLDNHFSFVIMVQGISDWLILLMSINWVGNH